MSTNDCIFILLAFAYVFIDDVVIASLQSGFLSLQKAEEEAGRTEEEKEREERTRREAEERYMTTYEIYNYQVKLH